MDGMTVNAINTNRNLMGRKLLGPTGPWPVRDMSNPADMATVTERHRPIAQGQVQVSPHVDQQAAHPLGVYVHQATSTVSQQHSNWEGVPWWGERAAHWSLERKISHMKINMLMCRLHICPPSVCMWVNDPGTIIKLIFRFHRAN